MPDELAGLSEEARRLALDRFRILQPHLEQSQSLQSVALTELCQELKREDVDTTYPISGHDDAGTSEAAA
jgi:hypothetical protein